MSEYQYHGSTTIIPSSPKKTQTSTLSAPQQKAGIHNPQFSCLSKTVKLNGFYSAAELSFRSAAPLDQ